MREVFVAVAIGALGCGRFSFDDREDALSPGDSVAPRSCVSQLAGYGDQVCYLRPDDSVWCWGGNAEGALGDGTFMDRRVPGPSLMTNALAVDAGEQHVCATRRDGTLACWGHNSAYQIGDGTMTNREVPTMVNLTADIQRVRAGQWHTCATLVDGTGWCWGDNSNGALEMAPGVSSPTPRVMPSVLGGALDFTIGDLFTCALRPDKTVWCIGRGDFGELGDGMGQNRSTWAPIQNMPDPVEKIVAGCHRHVCAVTAPGDVWCWGDNEFGQVSGTIGTPSFTLPHKVVGIGKASLVGVGGGHTCALELDGDIWCWGLNQFGELGGGAITPPSGPVKAQVNGNVVELQGGCANTYAVLDDRVLVAWGSALLIGTGTTVNQPTPIEVPLPCP